MSLTARSSTALALAAAVGVALAAAGCGSESEVSTAADQPEVAGAPDPEALEAFRECMSDQGVDVPEGPFRFGGPPSGEEGEAPSQPSPEQLRALEACRDELPVPEGGGLQIAPPPSE
jgi:hypothetical protein